MRGRRHAPRQQLITRVNVTPIIDVALVLVIILLVTAPMLSVADLPVDLPAAHTREAENQRNVSITLSSGGHVAVDEEVVERAALRGKLAAKLRQPGNEGVLVVVRADAGADAVTPALGPTFVPWSEARRAFRRSAIAFGDWASSLSSEGCAPRRNWMS